MKPVYMDHAATTALSETALNAMLPYFREVYGNPSAVHDMGQAAKNAVEKSRDRIAKAIGALRTEIVFTSGGTEGDNWVLRGVCRAKRSKGRHIVASAIEHNAVLRTLADLETEGFEVTLLKPDRRGQIAPEQLEAALRPDTILVSVMLANNVVGTVLDIPALVAVARRHRVAFHTDAVQAVGHIPVNARALGVDFLTMSAHKFGGPKGMGAVYCRLPNRLPAMITGGGQEKELRSGTENVPGIVGMAAALEEAVAGLDGSQHYLNGLRDHFIAEALKIPGVELTGDPANRLPGFCSFVVGGVTHSVLLVNELNARGFCVSSGSACSAASKEASHVLLALGWDKAVASAALRVTLGMDNTAEDVDAALAALRDALDKLRGERVARAPRLEGRVAEIGGAPEDMNE